MIQEQGSELVVEPNIRLSPRYFAALAYASGLHAGQAQAGTVVPCVSHLLGVN